MDHLKPKPPITRGQIKALFNNVAQVKTAKVDGVVLSNLLKLCYLCGLRKGELVGLRIGDVAQKRVVKDTIKIVDQEPIDLEPKAKRLLERHIDYLKKNGYRLYSSKPLFPTRAREPYKERTLQNHLKSHFNAMSTEIGLEKIRKAGVCHFYDDLKKVGIKPQTCLEKTADFARISLRSTTNLLLDQIQPAGPRPDLTNPVETYLKEIEDLEHSLRNSENPKDRGDRDIIFKKIENAPDLNANEKDALKTELKKSVERAISQPRVKREPAPKNLNKALREAIMNTKLFEDSTPPEDKWSDSED